MKFSTKKQIVEEHDIPVQFPWYLSYEGDNKVSIKIINEYKFVSILSVPFESRYEIGICDWSREKRSVINEYSEVFISNMNITQEQLKQEFEEALHEIIN